MGHGIAVNFKGTRAGNDRIAQEPYGLLVRLSLVKLAKDKMVKLLSKMALPIICAVSKKLRLRLILADSANEGVGGGLNEIKRRSVIWKRPGAIHLAYVGAGIGVNAEAAIEAYRGGYLAHPVRLIRLEVGGGSAKLSG